MKKIILFSACYLFHLLVFAQCPSGIVLKSTNGNCLGNTSIQLTGAVNAQKISWYKNGTPIDSIVAYKGTVAGGNGLGKSANRLNYPNTVFVDNEKNIYVCDNSNHRIQKWVPGASVGTTIAGISSLQQMDLPVNFDLPTVDYGLIGFDGAERSSIAPDPLVLGNTVAKVIRSVNALPTAGTKISALLQPGFYSKIPFTVTNQKLYINVLSPQAGVPVRLKLSERANPSHTVEAEATVTSTNVWQTLEFNFANPVAGTPSLNLGYNYDNATIYFNYGTAGAVIGERTYYFDQLQFTPEAGAIDNVLLPLNFESTTAAYSFGDFDGGSCSVSANPNVSSFNPSAKVAKMVKGPGQTWGGSLITLSAPIDFSVNKVVRMKILSPKVGMAVYLKAETLDGVNYYDRQITTTVANEWEDVAFDFSGINTSLQYQRLVFIFDNGVVGDGSSNFTYYFDDIRVASAAVSLPGSGASQLSYPDGLFVDAIGNVYISDNGNHRVQKWVPGATSGITVAGGNGQGVAANQLNYPGGIFVDVAGNVFVADNSNHRVQKWGPGATSGITVAGGNGQGVAANQLNYPHGVSVDAAGNVFVIDDNQRVQKWVPGATSGITVAGGNGQGTGANQLNYAWGLFVDNTGNIFVSDNGNHRIQKWAPGALKGVTVAGGNGQGNAINQLTYPSSVFVDADNVIYICDNGNHRVQKWIQNIDSNFIPTSVGRYNTVSSLPNACQFTSNIVNIYPTGTANSDILFNTYEVNCLKRTPKFSVTTDKELVSPVFQWYRNGSPISLANDSVYKTATLVNGDSLKCKITYNAGGCLSTDVVYTQSRAYLKDPVYTFVGNGNWSLAANWTNTSIPPSDLQCCSKIIINPSGQGECVVDVPVRIPSCVDFSVNQGKKIRVPGNLNINYDSTLVLNDNVHLQDSTETQLVSTKAEEELGVYKFTYSGAVPQYAIGDVLLGAEGDGYIRRITGITQIGNTVTYQTVQASLGSAFKQGKISFSTAADESLKRSAKNLSGAAYNFPFNDVTLFQSGGLSLKLSNGSISLDPNFNFDLDYGFSKIKYFLMSCKNATLNSKFQIDLSTVSTDPPTGGGGGTNPQDTGVVVNPPPTTNPVNAFGDINLVDEEDTLKSVSKTFIVPIRILGIPFNVKVKMDLDIICKYSANIAAAVKFNKSYLFESNNTMDIGVEYSNKVWTPTYRFNSNNNISPLPLTATGNANANIKVELVPVLRFKIAGIAGPYLSIGLNQEYNCGVASPSLDWDFTVDNWIRTTLGVYAEVLEEELFDFNKVWETDKLTYSTPYRISKVSGDNQTGYAGQILPTQLTVRVFDDHDKSQSNVPVHFTTPAGVGGALQNDVLTDANGYAKVYWSLGQPSGLQTIQASIRKHDGTDLQGSPITFSATAITQPIIDTGVNVINKNGINICDKYKTQPQMKPISDSLECNTGYGFPLAGESRVIDMVAGLTKIKSDMPILVEAILRKRKQNANRTLFDFVR